MKSSMSLLVAALTLVSCDSAPTQPRFGEAPALSATSTVTHFSTFFQATALCPAEIGRIQFSGTIEGTDATRVDGTGETHRTRAFRVQGLDGVNLDYGTTYRVQGGAEMLSWNTKLGQTPGEAAKSLHAGTLVFEPVDGGSRVIAHHAIRYIENGHGEPVVDFHSWTCRTH